MKRWLKENSWKACQNGWHSSVFAAASRGSARGVCSAPALLRSAWASSGRRRQPLLWESVLSNKALIHDWLQTCYQICLHLVCNVHSTFCSRPISSFSQIHITLREEKSVAKCVVVSSAIIELDTIVVQAEPWVPRKLLCDYGSESSNTWWSTGFRSPTGQDLLTDGCVDQSSRREVWHEEETHGN